MLEVENGEGGTRMFTRRIIVLIISSVIILFLAGCGNIPESTDTIETKRASELTSEPDSDFLNQAAKPYQDTVIRGISEDTPPSVYVRDVLAPIFEEKTNIKVEMEVTDYAEMYDQSIKDMEQGTGIYDFIYIEQDFIYGYLDKEYLVNLSQALQNNPQLISPDFNPIDFTSFINEFKDPATGDLYGVPIEAFLKICLYRKDLFEDPAIQAAFMAEYNYPLTPAITIEQYRDNAEFFTRYGQEHELDLWGTTVQGAIGHPALFYEFFETIAPAFRVYNWGINLDNYKATVENGGQLNSEQTKEALSFWIKMLDYAPPESTESTWHEVAASFASGRAAQGLVYGENATWIATDSSRSKVVGKIGVVLPPASPGTIDDAMVGQGYIGYYDGAAFGIPHSSRNKEATLLWLQFLGQPSIQPEWATAGSRVVHLSTFDDPLVHAQDKKLNGYYTLMKEQGYLFAGAPPFPFHIDVRNVISPFIDKAITGELTPSEALDQAAAAADQELIRLGYGQ